MNNQIRIMHTLIWFSLFNLIVVVCYLIFLKQGNVNIPKVFFLVIGLILTHTISYCSQKFPIFSAHSTGSAVS